MNYNDIYPLDKIYSEKLGVAFSVCGAAVGGDSPAPGPEGGSDFEITDGPGLANAIDGYAYDELYYYQTKEFPQRDCVKHNLYVIYDGEKWFMPDTEWTWESEGNEYFSLCELTSFLFPEIEQYSTGTPVSGDEVVIEFGLEFHDEDDGYFIICEGSTATVLHNQTVPSYPYDCSNIGE